MIRGTSVELVAFDTEDLVDADGAGSGLAALFVAEGAGWVTLEVSIVGEASWVVEDPTCCVVVFGPRLWLIAVETGEIEEGTVEDVVASNVEVAVALGLVVCEMFG